MLYSILIIIGLLYAATEINGRSIYSNRAVRVICMAFTNSTKLLSYSKLMICPAIAVHDVYMQLRYNTMCMMSC